MVLTDVEVYMTSRMYIAALTRSLFHPPVDLLQKIDLLTVALLPPPIIVSRQRPGFCCDPSFLACLANKLNRTERVVHHDGCIEDKHVQRWEDDILDGFDKISNRTTSRATSDSMDTDT